MLQLSTEIIEIDGKEYTLFLNRAGIVSWEKITKLSKESEKMQEKYKKLTKDEDDDKPIEVKDGDNPFDLADDKLLEDLEEDEARLKEIYIKFYWIALYQNHKLPISTVRELFEKAEKEYGLEQLMNLANQMIENINDNRYGKKPVKKLKALKPIK